MRFRRKKAKKISQSVNESIECSTPPILELSSQQMPLQLLIDKEELERRDIKSKQTRVEEALEVEAKTQEIKELFVLFQKYVEEQAPVIDMIADNVEFSEHQVEIAAENITSASNHKKKYKKIMYPAVGGLFGACVLGPVGLIAGIKIGAVAAFSGAVFGYASIKILRMIRNRKLRKLE